MIASARAYGDDPVRALTAQRGPRRRCLPAAVAALSDGTGRSVPPIADILKILANSVWRARRAGGAAFDQAYDRARDAIDAALAVQALAALANSSPDDAAGSRPDAETPTDPSPPASERPAEGVPQGPKSKPVGRILMDTPRATAFHATPDRTAGAPLTSRILAHLADRDWSAPALATVLGEKELVVTQALKQLVAEGRASADEAPFEGARFRRWRLAGGAA
ncbi:hypothetical protein [Phenylobacterium sp.]|uniref:hypothetical protein n=1 Tax=Phenylobacterium sp. TaxID=1871053 RepID=UPI0035B13ABA